MEITYKIQFYSEWHCGSGLGAGAESDALVIKDENGLPYIPGKTLKGLLRDAAETLHGFGHCEQEFIDVVFGVDAEKSDKEPAAGRCFFFNAELTAQLKTALVDNQEKAGFLFRTHSSTAINDDGQAKEHSLRRIQTTIPLTLFAQIAGVPEEMIEPLEACARFVKRLGVNRNRGLGRCDMSICREVVR